MHFCTSKGCGWVQRIIHKVAFFGVIMNHDSWKQATSSVRFPHNSIIRHLRIQIKLAAVLFAEQLKICLIGCISTAKFSCFHVFKEAESSLVMLSEMAALQRILVFCIVFTVVNGDLEGSIKTLSHLLTSLNTPLSVNAYVCWETGKHFSL